MYSVDAVRPVRVISGLVVLLVELSCSFLWLGSDQYIALQSLDLSTENLNFIEVSVLSDSATLVILGRLSGA